MAVRPFDGICPDIHATAYIDPAATVIGRVAIGAHSSLWPGVVVRGDINSIEIGDNTNIQDNSILHVTHESPYYRGAALRVGNAVTVGHGVCLHGCEIEDNCLIGMGSLVLDRARVETGCLLGAGSLVAPGKVIESGWLWLGRPAKKVRRLTDQELEYLSYSARHYAALKDRYGNQAGSPSGAP